MKRVPHRQIRRRMKDHELQEATLTIPATLLDRVRAVFAEHGPVIERRMMGGVCFMVSGHMAGGISRGQLMVRVGRDAYAAALCEPHVTPLEMGGRRPVGYVRVAPESVENEADLKRWIDVALATVANLPKRTPT